MKKLDIDSKDKAILQVLQANCNLSVRQIAKKLDLSPTTVHNRIKDLEKNKVILGYHANVSSVKVGVPTTAIVLVTLKHSPGKDETYDMEQDELIRLLSAKPEITEAHILTGPYDMILKIRGVNEREVGKYVINTLREVSGIERTLTCMVIKTGKNTLNVKIP